MEKTVEEMSVTELRQYCVQLADHLKWGANSLYELIPGCNLTPDDRKGLETALEALIAACGRWCHTINFSNHPMKR